MNLRGSDPRWVKASVIGYICISMCTRPGKNDAGISDSDVEKHTHKKKKTGCLQFAETMAADLPLTKQAFHL